MFGQLFVTFAAEEFLGHVSLAQVETEGVGPLA
jgi:hypothetical protein